MLVFYQSIADSVDDRKKLDYIYEHYVKLMEKVAYQHTQDGDIVEDAVQNVFMCMINYINKGKIDDPASIKTKSLVCKATKHFVLQANAKLKKQVDLEEQDDIEKVSPFDAVTTNDILDYIKAMPDKYRDVLEFKVYYDLSNEEIAKLTNTTVATVRKRLERARALVKKYLNGEDEDV